MKIISGGKKDYYDYLQGCNGIDELIVYDRRNAFPINVNKICYNNPNINNWFKKIKILGDEKKKEIKAFQSRKVSKYDKGYCRDKIVEGRVFHFILEIGYNHYKFEIERYLDDNDEERVHLDFSFIGHNRIEKKNKLSKAPIALIPCKVGLFYPRIRWKINENEIIENPILYSTYIPKIIDATDVWNNVYEYLSSLKDKDIVDTRTNDMHIESNGFDKKISFRHRKK